jgi:hypothetical protein
MSTQLNTVNWNLKKEKQILRAKLDTVLKQCNEISTLLIDYNDYAQKVMQRVTNAHSNVAISTNSDINNVVEFSTSSDNAALAISYRQYILYRVESCEKTLKDINILFDNLALAETFREITIITQQVDQVISIIPNRNDVLSWTQFESSDGISYKQTQIAQKLQPLIEITPSKARKSIPQSGQINGSVKSNGQGNSRRSFSSKTKIIVKSPIINSPHVTTLDPLDLDLSDYGEGFGSDGETKEGKKGGFKKFFQPGIKTLLSAIILSYTALSQDNNSTDIQTLNSSPPATMDTFSNHLFGSQFFNQQNNQQNNQIFASNIQTPKITQNDFPTETLQTPTNKHIQAPYIIHTAAARYNDRALSNALSSPSLATLSPTVLNFLETSIKNYQIQISPVLTNVATFFTPKIQNSHNFHNSHNSQNSAQISTTIDHQNNTPDFDDDDFFGTPSIDSFQPIPLPSLPPTPTRLQTFSQPQLITPAPSTGVSTPANIKSLQSSQQLPLTPLQGNNLAELEQNSPNMPKLDNSQEDLNQISLPCTPPPSSTPLIPMSTSKKQKPSTINKNELSKMNYFSNFYLNEHIGGSNSLVNSFNLNDLYDDSDLCNNSISSLKRLQDDFIEEEIQDTAHNSQFSIQIKLNQYEMLYDNRELNLVLGLTDEKEGQNIPNIQNSEPIMIEKTPQIAQKSIPSLCNHQYDSVLDQGAAIIIHNAHEAVISTNIHLTNAIEYAADNINAAGEYVTNSAICIAVTQYGGIAKENINAAEHFNQLYKASAELVENATIYAQDGINNAIDALQPDYNRTHDKIDEDAVLVSGAVSGLIAIAIVADEYKKVRRRKANNLEPTTRLTRAGLKKLEMEQEKLKNDEIREEEICVEKVERISKVVKSAKESIVAVKQDDEAVNQTTTRSVRRSGRLAAAQIVGENIQQNIEKDEDVTPVKKTRVKRSTVKAIRKSLGIDVQSDEQNHDEKIETKNQIVEKVKKSATRKAPVQGESSPITPVRTYATRRAVKSGQASFY